LSNLPGTKKTDKEKRAITESELREAFEKAKKVKGAIVSHSPDSLGVVSEN